MTKNTKMKHKTELGLGAERWGLLSDKELHRLIRKAIEYKFTYIDTSTLYEGSIEAMMRILPTYNYKFKINIKIPMLLTPFRCPPSFGKIEVMIHNPSLLMIKNKEVIEKINNINAKNNSKIGCSVYTEEEAEAVIDAGCYGSLQVPVNLVDRRFSGGSFIDKCKIKKIRLMARSIFMRGVLVDNFTLPPYEKTNELMHLRKLICKNGKSVYEESKRFMKEAITPNYDVILLGSVTPNELDEFNEPIIGKCSKNMDEIIAYSRENMLYDPRTW